MPEMTPDDVQAKEDTYNALRTTDTGWLQLTTACDLWTSAFFLPMDQDGLLLLEGVPTSDTLRRYLRQPTSVYDTLVGKAVAASNQYSFFHWHSEFPEVFDDGGFDVVLGNPPWEQIQPEELEFFAEHDTSISALTGSKRKTAIQQLSKVNPELSALWESYRQGIGKVGNFARASNRFPLSAIGKLNTYQLFAEQFRYLANPTGRIGMIVPSGISTDDSTKLFFGDLSDKGAIVSLYDFENREGLFPTVHRSYKFCLLTLTGTSRRQTAGEFAFFLNKPEQLGDPDRKFALSKCDFNLINPNTRTCPIFRSRRDLEITRGIYQRVPILVDDGKGDEGNPWGLQFRQGLFNMTTDSRLFRTKEELEVDGWWLDGSVFHRGHEEYVPLYEAKLIHQFDHRWATYEYDKSIELDENLKRDPGLSIAPRYWVPRQEVKTSLEGKWDRDWLLGWRNVCRSTDERTTIATITPAYGVGHSLPLMFPVADAYDVAVLLANMCSFVFDYVARQKLGGVNMTLNYISQLTSLTPSMLNARCPWSENETIKEFIAPRALELIYVSEDLRPFAVEFGYDGPPYVWDAERRFELRNQIDAGFFHIYGISRDDVNYIMDTFPLVMRRDFKTRGGFNIKEGIIKSYDELNMYGTVNNVIG